MNDFKSLSEMESCLDVIRQAPVDEGDVVMIIARPITGGREILERCELNQKSGLLGDNWQARGDKHTVDGTSDTGRQLTIMNARTIRAITDSEARWPDAGDQFFVDFDLSDENLPSGTQLAIGEAVVEVTALPHLGCQKFGDRFGKDANQFVNSNTGKTLNIRGINVKVIKPGSVSKGNSIRKL